MGCTKNVCFTSVKYLIEGVETTKKDFLNLAL